MRVTKQYPLSGIRVTEDYIVETCPVCGMGKILTVFPPEREQVKMLLVTTLGTVKLGWPLAIALTAAASSLIWLLYELLSTRAW